MPWHLFVCERCGQAVARKTSSARRDAAPVHREDPSCGDGALWRMDPTSGPGGGGRVSTRRRSHRLRLLRRRSAPDLAGAAPLPPGAVLSPADDPSLIAHLRRSLPALPSLSLKLGALGLLARPGAVPRRELDHLAEGIAQDVAAAPIPELALEERLFDLLCLTRDRGALGATAMRERLRDDAVLLRLLRSALRPRPPGRDAVRPGLADLPWPALRELLGDHFLLERVHELAASPEPVRDEREQRALALAEASAREAWSAPRSAPG